MTTPEVQPLTQDEVHTVYSLVRQADPALASRLGHHLEGDAQVRAIRDLSAEVRALGKRLDATSARSEKIAMRMIASMVTVTVLAIVVLGASIGLSVSYGGISAGPARDSEVVFPDVLPMTEPNPPRPLAG